MKHYQANFKKIFITIIIICTFLTIASSTTYTFTGSGNWSNPARWSPSIPPNIQMPNDSIIIDGSCNFNIPDFTISSTSTVVINSNSQLNILQSPFINDGTVYIYGTLQVSTNRSLENNGTIQNDVYLRLINGSTFINNGTLNNNGSLTTGLNTLVTNNNTFTNLGIIEINQTATLDNNGTIFNDLSSTITNWGTLNSNGIINNNSTLINIMILNIQIGGTLNNDGILSNFDSATLMNYGTFNNETPFLNRGQLDNFGIFNNHNTVQNYYTSCLLTNHEGASFYNYSELINDYFRPMINDGTMISSGSITNRGTLTNNGTLTSSGILIIEFSSTLNTNGTLNNVGTLTNYWKLTNNGTLNNSGTLINEKNYTNNNTINNSSSMINNPSGTLTNTSSHTLNNNAGGTFTNGGTINNNGYINNNIDSEFFNNIGATLTHYGVLNNHSTLTNNATISNYNNITNDGVFTINGILTNQTGSSLINNLNSSIFINQNATFNNYNGSFTNNGSTTIYLGGTLHSKSTLTNGGTLDNYGTLRNSSSANLNNNGVFTIHLGGILNSNSSLIRNNIDGIINNYGALNLYSSLRNYGTINNNNVLLLTSQLSNESGTINNNEGGNIKGTGQISQFGFFINNNLSSISPGFSPGRLRGTVNIDLGAATLHCEINGIVQGTSYDWFSVAGTFTISPNSKLLVDWGNFTPSAGDVFTIITANLINDTFLISNIVIPPINDLDFVIGYTDTTVTISVLGPLPVKMINFYGKYQGEDIMLTWQTVSEVNNHGFDILRSRDEKSWTSIGFVSGHGSSQNTHLYTYFDEDPENGVSFYRLRQIDMDGKSELSNIINVTVNDKPKIQIYPSPTQMFLHIKGLSEETQYTIVQANSQVLQSGHVSTDTPINVQNLMPGMYYLKLNDQVLEFIKN